MLSVILPSVVALKISDLKKITVMGATAIRIMTFSMTTPNITTPSIVPFSLAVRKCDNHDIGSQ